MTKRRNDKTTIKSRLFKFCSSHSLCFKLLLSLGGCIACGYLLSLWERVPFSHHIVAACYKVQHTNNRHRNANVFLTINMSDFGNLGIMDENGSVLTDNVQIRYSVSNNNTTTLRQPHYSVKKLCEDEKAYNSLFMELNRSSVVTKVPLNSDVIEIFHIVNDEENDTSPWEWHFLPLYNKSKKGVTAIRTQPILDQRGGLMDELFWGNILQDLKNDHDHFPVDGFLLDSVSTRLSTTVLLSESGDNINLIAKPSSISLIGILKAMIKPYDISKQIVYVGYLVEAIDTFQIKLNFGEVSKFSTYRDHGETITSTSITHTSTASERVNRGGSDRLYYRTKLAGNQENMEYTASLKDLEKSAISLYVEKKGSRMIQWIRISLLVMLLGYFFIRFFVYLTHIIGLKRWFYQREY